MKKIYIILISISCYSCRTVYQVTETESTNVKADNLDKKYFYEDDNLKIYYDLWSRKGTLTFTLYNKTNKPIYIDWSHSNFIWNGYSIDYQKDVEIVKGIGSSTVLNNGIITQGFSIRTKERPQTQLPPNSQIVVHKFNIDMPTIKFEYSEQKVKEIEYSKETSFFKFRNYLAYTFDKDMSDLKFIDNDFWVKKVYEMSEKSFINNVYPNAGLKNNKFFNIGKGAKHGKIIYGKNIVSINLFNLYFNDVNISYERMFFKQKLSIKVPFYYGYNQAAGSRNADNINLFGRFPQSYEKRPKQSYYETGDFSIHGGYAMGIHLKVYPTGQGFVRGFIDIGAEVGRFNIIETYHQGYPKGDISTESFATYKGAALGGGLSIQPSKFFNISLDIGLSSGSYNYKGVSKTTDVLGVKSTKLPSRIGLSVGFRF